MSSNDPNFAGPPAGMTYMLSLAEAKARLPDPGPFAQLLLDHEGRPVNKWAHYLPFYDRILAPYRGKPVRLLEIGVNLGGSLELWRKYFGPDATIFGIDIDPACAGRVDAPNQVRIGSQADREFLRSVVHEMGGVDIVIDDGSHVASHQRDSFRALWPLVATGGLYIIEDMHTAYWSQWGGGYQRPGTAVALVKQLLDDMHGWYHAVPGQLAARTELGMISMSDSLVAIEKVHQPLPPGHFWSGKGFRT